MKPHLDLSSILHQKTRAGERRYAGRQMLCKTIPGLALMPAGIKEAAAAADQNGSHVEDGVLREGRRDFPRVTGEI